MIALPYGRQTITEADIEAVATVLRSDWLTTGPKVAEFERALAEFVGVRHAVVVNSGTAAYSSFQPRCSFSESSRGGHRRERPLPPHCRT